MRPLRNEQRGRRESDRSRPVIGQEAKKSERWKNERIGGSQEGAVGVMSLPISYPRPWVLVHVGDESLRADIQLILAKDGYDIHGTADESELRRAIRSASQCVLVVDVGSVGEATLDQLSSEGRVPRLVVFSSARSETASKLPFRPDVLRAAVSRAFRADDGPPISGPMEVARRPTAT
jgi:hypothetical protein